MTVVRCGESPIPPVLAELPRIHCDEVPGREDVQRVREALPESGRLVVCARDAGFAALVTRFMRSDMLSVEFAYVSDVATPATENYGLPTGAAAAKLALSGTAEPVPLVRDDTGTVLVGVARLTGSEETDGSLTGEAYADDTRVFLGTVSALEVRPTTEMPGARASDMRRHGLLLRRRWVPARAVQLGTTGAWVTRDGVTGRRPVKRTSFYRHTEPLLLVRQGGGR